MDCIEMLIVDSMTSIARKGKNIYGTKDMNNWFSCVKLA